MKKALQHSESSAKLYNKYWWNNLCSGAIKPEAAPRLESKRGAASFGDFLLDRKTDSISECDCGVGQRWAGCTAFASLGRATVFKSGLDEIWQESAGLSSIKYAPIDGVGFLTWLTSLTWYDDCPPLAAATSAGCPLARRTRVTLLECCLRIALQLISDP